MTTYNLNNYFEELVKETLEEKKQMEQNDDTVTMIDESAKTQDFFQNNRCKKEKEKCTSTRIKSRNFLSNIVYVGINREDFCNEDFIFDMYLLIAKNLNRLLIDRKITDENKHEMLYMLWKECTPLKFYQHICKEKHVLYLNGKKCATAKSNRNYK